MPVFYTPPSSYLNGQFGSSSTMNLKFNNEVRGPIHLIPKKKPVSSVKEERRRTGRYIAILVGICLFLLAIYHAWVRRIPIVASLVVPALIMFIYVGWVLYTASRDKHRLLDAEAAMQAAALEAADNNATSCGSTHNNVDTSVVSSKESSKANSPVNSHKEWAEISSALRKGENSSIRNEERNLVKPVILINDKPPEDLDQKWTNLVENVINNDKFKGFQNRRKYKRKFCRSKRHAVFKRSYSIA